MVDRVRVNTQSPTTEAVLIRVSSSPELLGIVHAREIQRDIQRLIDRNWGSGVTVAIEADALEAARAEGRREAVRQLRDFRSELWRAVETKVGLPLAALLGMFDAWVAALNTSESPPTAPIRFAGDNNPDNDMWTCSCGLSRPVTGSYGCADCGDGRPDSWDRVGAVDLDEHSPDRTSIALSDWLTYWGDDDPDGWEPEMVDGCMPHACSCGFVALIHQSRLALGRPCCGEDEHPGLARLHSEPSSEGETS